jgi:hypothetical protein
VGLRKEFPLFSPYQLYSCLPSSQRVVALIQSRPCPALPLVSSAELEALPPVLLTLGEEAPHFLVFLPLREAHNAPLSLKRNITSS